MDEIYNEQGYVNDADTAALDEWSRQVTPLTNDDLYGIMPQLIKEIPLKTDSTQMKCFINCPKRYYNNYVRCIARLEFEEESVDRLFGEAIHKGLEVFYKTKDMEQGKQKFADSFTDVEDEKVKTKDNGLILLDEYVGYHNHNFSQWEVIATEQIGMIDISGHEYLVKIDLVIRLNGNVYVVDFKTTTSKNRQGFMKKFKLDIQPTGYIKWCKNTFGACSGFIPVAMFMGNRERAYKGEPAGFHCNFDWDIFNRTEEHLQDWEHEMSVRLGQIENCHATNLWLKNTDYCSSYKGCQYADLCSTLDDPSVITSLYTEINPFKYLEQ